MRLYPSCTTFFLLPLPLPVCVTANNSGDHCDHNVTDGSPLQPIPVTYTRDRCAYVVDLTLYTVERTAFGRQGPEVRILSPRPISSLVSRVYGSQSRLSPLETLTWHTLGTVRNQYGLYQEAWSEISRSGKEVWLPTFRLGAVVGLFNTRVPTGFTFLADLTTGDRRLFLI